jgi:hypothetical protein
MIEFELFNDVRLSLKGRVSFFEFLKSPFDLSPEQAVTLPFDV